MRRSPDASSTNISAGCPKGIFYPILFLNRLKAQIFIITHLTSLLGFNNVGSLGIGKQRPDSWIELKIEWVECHLYRERWIGGALAQSITSH